MALETGKGLFAFGGKRYPVYTIGDGTTEYIALYNTGNGFCADMSLDQLVMMRDGVSLADIVSASTGDRREVMKTRSKNLRKKIVELVDEKIGIFFGKGHEPRSFKACKKGGYIKTIGMFKRVIRSGGYMDDRAMILGSEIYNLEGFALVKADSDRNLMYAQSGILEPVRRSAALVLWDEEASHFQALYQV